MKPSTPQYISQYCQTSSIRREKEFMALALCACGSKPAESSAAASAETSAAPVTLNVFAAASMTETLNEIIAQYKTVAPNVTITPTYDSSGTLYTQIKEGADCDLFISAAQKQMNQLDGSLKADTDKNPDGLDLIDTATRKNILENKVVLVVPKDNPANIKSFKDLANAKLIALGNSDVPVGSYSLEILQSLGLDIKSLEAAGKVSYGSNVKEVTTQVTQGSVDCGIVYATDAYSAGLTVVDTATKDMFGSFAISASTWIGSPKSLTSFAPSKSVRPSVPTDW